MKEELDFEKLKDRCLKILDKNKYISVATAIDNQVRVRVVDYANVELSIGFVTWENTVKMEHIKKNPFVSLCIDNLQIQGTATVSGHPQLNENKTFWEKYLERNPNPYKNFAIMNNVSTIIAQPTLMILMTYSDKHLYSDHLDLVQNTAFRKVLSPWDAES